MTNLITCTIAMKGALNLELPYLQGALPYLLRYAALLTLLYPES